MNLKYIFYHFYPTTIIVFCIFFLNSCATYELQKGKELKTIQQKEKSTEDSFQLFLVGDAGNADEPQAQQTLNFLKNKLDSANKNSMLIFLGDNIYPVGMPKVSDKEYQLARIKMENQLKITKNFEGKTLVIPGNHDWYHGLEGLKAQENFVEEYLNQKKVFLPQNGCPIDDINLNDNIKLIVVDTEWYLTDWDKNYGINKNCEIKTREDFFTELDDIIKKNQNKTIVIALHHPVISSGNHAGFDSFSAHIFPFKSNIPVPVVSSALNILRKTSGVTTVDLSNEHYAELANRIKNIVQDNKNIILVSGHDHNLQYHEQGNIRQIISGAGSKTDPSTITKKTDFSYGGSGFAELTIAKDGKSEVHFFSTKNGHFQNLVSIPVLESQESLIKENTTDLPEKYTATVYPVKLAKKGLIQNFLFGEKYRPYFGVPIEAPIADLSVLKGGLKPIREGGGHQSNSLRFINPEQQIFTFRQLSKSATRFLKTVALKNKSFGNEFDNTFTEKFLQDFYTSNHPFTPFAVGHMAEKLDIFHTNPKLYFLPKQNLLGKYNDAYGDRLYMLEEQISEDPTTLSYFGNAERFDDTDDAIRNLQKPQKYEVDERAYVRARLFDILIGDWDRHDDQWKWAAYQNGDKTLYKPIPKDRDQAFSKYGGKLLPIIMTAEALKHMKTFKAHQKKVKWLNREAYPLDLIFAKHSGENVWLEEAKYIQQNLTDEDIDYAFLQLPKEVQDQTAEDIKTKLIARRKELDLYAAEYFKALQNKVIITGTDKVDFFEIEKTKNSIVVLHYEKNKSGEKILISKREIDPKKTKELWVYGLNDNDVYTISGSENNRTKIRLIGGYDEDHYLVENGSHVKIYDFRSEENTYTKGTKRISDDYKTNTYDHKKPMYNNFNILPMANYNPDDGVQFQGIVGYRVNNFIREPYSQRHNLKLGLFTATGSFSATYKGIFKKAVSQWDLELDAFYTTPKNTQNFFGLSNVSTYSKDLFKEDFYRVRRSIFSFAPSISRKGWMNFKHQIQAGFESNKIEQNNDRIVMNSADINPSVFKSQNFGNINYIFNYQNIAEKYFPFFGMDILLNTGWKTSFSDKNRNFFSVNGNLNLDHRIDKKGRFILANSTDFNWINNNNFEFYQAASIGGDRNLRGYKNFRFSGKSAIANSTDIRWNFGKLANKIAPADWGIFTGYDIGRVWNDGENSRKWHQSYGGGIWLGLVESFSARAQYFY
uniref:metallophosphoesterase n=1 Tax=uncultured Chryseobacterium sp. TaxID=259322 RepID=UPI00261862AF